MILTPTEAPASPNASTFKCSTTNTLPAGTVKLCVSGNPVFTPTTFVQASNGKLVLASAEAIMRLLPNGQVDAAFDARDALAGSFFAVFAAIFSAFLTILTWPIRLVTRVAAEIRLDERRR